jgi:hypothetical protein
VPKIYAPHRSFTGVGAAGVVFKDGVGATDDPAAVTYFRDAGYGIDRPPTEAGLPSTGDARNFAEPIMLGTPLRDAAVDPRPTDFLPPTNAGEADPHGPLVVAPGLHAAPPAPIRPGPVAVDDPVRQSAEESDLAEAVLVKHELATDATRRVATEQRLEEIEARDAAAEPKKKSASAGATDSTEAPGSRDSKAEWVKYAMKRGMSRDEAEDMSKADLQKRYG